METTFGKRIYTVEDGGLTVRWADDLSVVGRSARFPSSEPLFATSGVLVAQDDGRNPVGYTDPAPTGSG